MRYMKELNNMKISKSPLAQPFAIDQSYEHESADDSDLSKYLKRIAYWVGQVLFEFNRLETAFTAVIGERINGANVRGYEYVFLTGLTYAHKVELLQRIYRYQITLINPEARQMELRKKTDDIIAELKALGAIRNAIIHSDYYSLDRNGFVRKEIRFGESDAEEQWVKITRDDLVENLNRISAATLSIEEFDEEVLL
jgi:hypothetical protein